MTADFTLQNVSAILPDRVIEGTDVVVRDGRIAELGSAPAVETGGAGGEVINAGGAYLAPGFIDIHVHGGGGADFMDGTVEAVKTALETHLRHGTTTLFPTTTTGSPARIEAMLDACSAVRDSWRACDGRGARVQGVHFYGPYFAADKCGIHADRGRRDPDPTEYEAAFDRGIIEIATCAAELPGAEEFFRQASGRGYLVTCGHSNSTWEEMQRGFDAGMSHVDHFWCAMSSVPSIRERLGCPMQGSMEQFVLANAEMSTEVLADGEHLAPELLRFAFQMKGADRLCLVTDASRAVDMPAGEYRFGPQEEGVAFRSDGKVGRSLDDGGLASTVVGMDHMVRQMLEDSGASLAEVIRMATLTPARLTGIDGDVGSLEVGKKADLVLLDRELNVQRVWLEGWQAMLASP